MHETGLEPCLACSKWSVHAGRALSGVVRLAGHRTTKQKFASLIPGRSTCLSYGFHAQLGERTRGNRSMFFSHINVSLPPFLSL